MCVPTNHSRTKSSLLPGVSFFHFFFSLYIDLESECFCAKSVIMLPGLYHLYFFSDKKSWLFVKQKIKSCVGGGWLTAGMVMVNGPNSKQLLM